MLAWGKSLKCEKLCQPHRTGPQQEQRDCFLGSLSPDRTSVRRPEGQKCLSDYQMSQMWYTSACRVQTKPVSELRKPWGGWTLGSTLQQWEWVTSIDFKDAYFHIPIQEQSRTYQISCPGSDIPVHSTVFQSVHCTHGAHCSSKGVETDGHTQGYNNPPVLRRLVGESHIPPGLSPA